MLDRAPHGSSARAGPPVPQGGRALVAAPAPTVPRRLPGARVRVVPLARQVPEARSLIGRTDLFQIAALASRAKVAIGNDTGPMHMSAAAGAPTLTLFATQISDPFRNGPRGPHPVAITTPTLETVQVDAVWRALVAMGLVAH